MYKEQIFWTVVFLQLRESDPTPTPSEIQAVCGHAYLFKVPKSWVNEHSLFEKATEN